MNEGCLRNFGISTFKYIFDIYSNEWVKNKKGNSDLKPINFNIFNMKQKTNGLSRRKFLGNAAAAGAVGALGISQLLSACDRIKITKDLVLPPLLDQAPDGELIKAGVIGCGGRGTGAARNFFSAGPNFRFFVLADFFRAE